MNSAQGLTAMDAWARRRPWVADSAFALVLAVLAFPVGIAAFGDSSWSTAGKAFGVAALVVGHIAIALRRVAPRAVFLVVSALMLVLVLAPDLGGDTAREYGGPIPPVVLPSALVFPIALYTVAVWCAPVTSSLALGISGIGAVLTVARLWDFEAATTTQAGANPVGSWQLFLVVGVLAASIAPWSLGRFRRVRAQYVESLEERAVLEEENRERHGRDVLRQERSRIAREMHDVVSHSLAIMVSQAEGGRMMAQRDPSVTVPVLETVARTGQEAMRGMRGLLDALDPDGAPSTEPQPTLAQISALLERVRESGVTVVLDESGTPGAIDSSVELAAYRIVQESLTNVLKHAGQGAAVQVQLGWTSRALEIRIRNDGVEPNLGTVTPGRGLTGMRERVGLLGGSLEAGPDGADGFLVTARIPRQKERS